MSHLQCVNHSPWSRQLPHAESSDSTHKKSNTSAERGPSLESRARICVRIRFWQSDNDDHRQGAYRGAACCFRSTRM